MTVRRLEGPIRSKGPESLEGVPYIASIRVNADTRMQMVELGWLHQGRTITEVVPRASCLTEKHLENLVNLGFPLSQPTASLFVEYCRAYLEANLLREVRVVDRLGWQGEAPNETFMHGRTVIGSQQHAVRLDDRDPAVAELADGFAIGGDQSEATALLSEIATFPVAAFVAMAALASVLLAKLGV